MWPNREWWAALGFTEAHDYLTKELPNKWELCVSTSVPGIPTKPPIDGQTLYVVAYEPDGNTATSSFSMQRDCSINPDTMIAALLKAVEDQILGRG